MIDLEVLQMSMPIPHNWVPHVGLHQKNEAHGNSADARFPRHANDSISCSFSCLRIRGSCNHSTCSLDYNHCLELVLQNEMVLCDFHSVPHCLPHNDKTVDQPDWQSTSLSLSIFGSV